MNTCAYKYGPFIAVARRGLALICLLTFGLTALPGTASPGEMGCVAEKLKSYDEQNQWREPPKEILDTLEIQRRAGKNYFYEQWGRPVEDELDMLRFVDREDYEARKEFEHGTEMYGIKNYEAWRRAGSYLDSIPLGQFKLTPDVISKAHELASAGMNPTLKRLSRFIPEGWVPSKGGVYKKRWSIGRDPIFSPIDEASYQTLKSNPWLGGFIELPGLSREGARRGAILYTLPKDVPAKMEELRRLFEDNRNSMDPIELAARIQQALVSIHPFVDGNGRLSRLIADRVLKEFGLPKPLLRDTHHDLYSSAKDWALEYRIGMQRYAELLESSGRFRDHSIRTIMRVGSLLDRQSTKPLDPIFAHDVMISSTIDDETYIGGRPFVLLRDGFFWDANGIPYVLHEGTLYPISDGAYLLYMQNGALVKESGRGGVMRELSQNHVQIARSNIDLARKIKAAQIDADKIPVAPYSAIDQANREGDPWVYPWQKQVFVDAITVRDERPEAVLSRAWIAQTDFEKGAQWKHDPRAIEKPYAVLAQYEAVDLRFYAYQKFAEKNFPDLVPKVLESRRKLHRAGRAMIEGFERDRAKLNGSEKDKLAQDNKLRLYDELVSFSKLRYETFDQALKYLDDNSIHLLRADISSAQTLGMMSLQDYRAIFRALPGSERIERKIKEGLGWVKKNRNDLAAKLKGIMDRSARAKALAAALPRPLNLIGSDPDAFMYEAQGLYENALNKVFHTDYDQRKALDEFQREYVGYVLHAGGSGVKVGKSFTSNVELLATNSENPPFIPRGYDGRIFLVRMPKSQVEWNYASLFSSEYEFLNTHRVPPSAIIKSFALKDLGKGYWTTHEGRLDWFKRRYLDRDWVEEKKEKEPKTWPSAFP